MAPISISDDRSKPAGAGALRIGFTRSKRHAVGRLAGEVFAVAEAAVGVLTKATTALCRLRPRPRCIRNRARRECRGSPAQGAVGVQRDPVARPHRRNRHRAGRRRDAGARQQPAGEQRFGERHRQRIAPGNAENRKAVGEARAALFFRHPGERQAGLRQRAPQRRLPLAVAGAVDGCGSARSANIRAAVSATILSLSVSIAAPAFHAMAGLFRAIVRCGRTVGKRCRILCSGLVLRG